MASSSSAILTLHQVKPAGIGRGSAGISLTVFLTSIGLSNRSASIAVKETVCKAYAEGEDLNYEGKGQ